MPPGAVAPATGWPLPVAEGAPCLWLMGTPSYGAIFPLFVLYSVTASLASTLLGSALVLTGVGVPDPAADPTRSALLLGPLTLLTLLAGAIYGGSGNAALRIVTRRLRDQHAAPSQDATPGDDPAIPAAVPGARPLPIDMVPHAVSGLRCLEHSQWWLSLGWACAGLSLLLNAMDGTAAAGTALLCWVGYVGVLRLLHTRFTVALTAAYLVSLSAADAAAYYGRVTAAEWGHLVAATLLRGRFPETHGDWARRGPALAARGHELATGYRASYNKRDTASLETLLTHLPPPPSPPSAPSL